LQRRSAAVALLSRGTARKRSGQPVSKQKDRDMFEWFRQHMNGAPFQLRPRAPGAATAAAINRFLADTAEIAEDAALVIDGDLRRLIRQLTPADAAQYESIVRVPGAFPPYLVWAALTALEALPCNEVFEPGLARQVESRLLDAAARTRGKRNARLLSTVLYRLQRAAAAGGAPLDALVPRFWEEVQHMGALSEGGRDILSSSSLAHETLAGRFMTASGLLDRRYGGNFWASVKAAIEQEAP
jgi:hypothetical protein